MSWMSSVLSKRGTLGTKLRGRDAKNLRDLFRRYVAAGFIQVDKRSPMLPLEYVMSLQLHEGQGSIFSTAMMLIAAGADVNAEPSGDSPHATLIDVARQSADPRISGDLVAVMTGVSMQRNIDNALSGSDASTSTSGALTS